LAGPENLQARVARLGDTGGSNLIALRLPFRQHGTARLQTGTATAAAWNAGLPAFTLTRAGLHGTAVAVHRLESLAAGLLDDFWVAARSTRCRPRTRHGRRHFCIAASFKRFVTTLDALIE
jgi:hypothetical protein